MEFTVDFSNKHLWLTLYLIIAYTVMLFVLRYDHVYSKQVQQEISDKYHKMNGFLFLLSPLIFPVVLIVWTLAVVIPGIFSIISKIILWRL